MSAHEALEHAEHAAHAGHGSQGKTGTFIGLTMAVLGVLLAFCSALVGAERTELIKAMVEQSDAHAKYQAQNLKHRMVMSQLETFHSNLLSKQDVEQIDAQLAALAPPAAAPSPSVVPAAAVAPAPATARGIDESTTLKGLKIASKEIVRILAPDEKDAKRLVVLARKYDREVEAGRAWTESYDESIEAHVEGAEHYEHAQLAAEIGIVIASIALLLQSRKTWAVSLLLGALSMGGVGLTYAKTHAHVSHGDANIAAKKKAYQSLRGAQSQTADDEKLLRDVESVVGKLD